jgi:tetratricopeptide (TPR) repeat protein
MIAQKFPGPFFALDCDTAGFIYLGIAEQWHLPLHLVAIPAFNRRAGHTFVRWREGSHYLDWETMDGTVATDDFYAQEWKINAAEVQAQSALTDLSPGQVIGCEHYLIAIQYERLGEYEKALRELSTALALHPQNLDARDEFAWVTATSPGLRQRDNAAALADALFVVRLVDDPDAQDTLAAAYASAGMFDLAVKEERTALRNGARSSEAKPGYQQRLNLYQQQTAYRQSESAPQAGGMFKP